MAINYEDPDFRNAADRAEEKTSRIADFIENNLFTIVKAREKAAISTKYLIEWKNISGDLEPVEYANRSLRQQNSSEGNFLRKKQIYDLFEKSICPKVAESIRAINPEAKIIDLNGKVNVNYRNILTIIDNYILGNDPSVPSEGLSGWEPENSGNDPDDGNSEQQTEEPTDNLSEDKPSVPSSTLNQGSIDPDEEGSKPRQERIVFFLILFLSNE